MARLLPLLAPALAMAAALLGPTHAIAQLGGTRPGPSYFAAVDALHAANFGRAERAMRSELRGAIKTVDSRWVDSIIYAAGLGEALYQQGRLPEALAQFDAAIDLFLANARWLREIRFQQDLREDNSRPRRVPAWAQPTVPTPLADLPRVGLFAIGQIDQSNVLNNGGVLVGAQYWRLDCEELARAIAWTLYRRGELLGPLGAYDVRTTNVTNRLGGGGLGQAGHWSAAWTELWWGLAEGAAGDAVSAQPHLQAATLMSGRYAHRLGALALLAQGRLAAGQGDAAAAVNSFRDALSLAVAYEDGGVLAEVLREWHTLSATDASAPGPPLAEVVAIAPRRSWRHAGLVAGMAIVERSLLAREGADGAAVLKSLFARERDAASGLLGREADRLNAWAAAAQARDENALRLADRAIASQTGQSRRLLQTQLATAWYRDGRLTPRTARGAFAAVLGDPSVYSWTHLPIDAITANRTPATEAFDLWFDAAVDRRDALLAIQIIDQQRRRELFSAYPLGGRLVACRWLLEAPEATLPEHAIEARANLERLLPEYAELRRVGIESGAALRDALAEAEGRVVPAVRRAADGLRANAERRENAVLQAALSRAVTPLVFPPQMAAAAAKATLAEGEAVIALHNASGDMHGVLLTSEGEHLWRIGPTDRVNRLVEELLRAVAGVNPQQKWTAEDLSSDDWGEPAETLAAMLFAESRLDASQLKRLWLVPDGAIWRAPLAVLPLPGASPEDPSTPLGDTVVSIVPTPGWPFRGRVEREGRSNVAWALSAEPIDLAAGDPMVNVGRVATPPNELEVDSVIAKAVAGRLAIQAGGVSPRVDPMGLRLQPGRDPGGSAGAFARLPMGDATQLALLGLGGGEAGGGRVRRARSASLTGAPELHLLGAFLAGGAETVLVERWRPGGERSKQLAAEWMLGLDRLAPTDAWRRSLALARTKPLVAEREPRFEATSDPAPTAEHPFWWAGYYVVD